MRITTLLVLVSMTAVACGGDDSGDDTASTDPTTTADPTTGPTTTSPTSTTTPDDTGSSSDSVDPDSGSSGDPTEDPTTTADPDTGTTDTGTGAACEAYCAAFLVTCQDAEGAGLDGADPYADMDACMTACEGFTVDDGTPMGGNDLECRAYHLGVAAAMPDMGHCGHADADGSGVCV